MIIQGVLNIFRRMPNNIEGPVMLTNVGLKIVSVVKKVDLF